MSDYLDEIQREINNRNAVEETLRNDHKWFALIAKIIPRYEQYESKAFELVKKYGLLKALKKVETGPERVVCTTKECEHYIIYVLDNCLQEIGCEFAKVSKDIFQLCKKFKKGEMQWLKK